MPSTPPWPRPESLETERLILRPRQAGDAPVMHRLWMERDPRVPLHRRLDASGHPTQADVAAGLEREGGAGLWLLSVIRREDGALLGYCGLVGGRPGGDDEPELAFELLSAAHGLGYATEAARSVVDWADESGIRRLWATVWDWNLPSQRVLEKLGFRDSRRVLPPGEHGRMLVTVREAPDRTPGVSVNEPPFSSVRGVVYRAVDPAFADGALQGSRSAARYSRPEQPTLYLSSSSEGVEAAMRAHRRGRAEELAILRFHVDADRVVDLRDASALAMAGVDADDAAAPWQDIVRGGGRPSSWGVRDQLESIGARGLIDPSRTAPGLWHLVLFRWDGEVIRPEGTVRRRLAGRPAYQDPTY